MALSIYFNYNVCKMNPILKYSPYKYRPNLRSIHSKMANKNSPVKGDLKMATVAKRPREENVEQFEQNIVNVGTENKIHCETRAKSFLKWFSSNDENFFSDKVLSFNKFI